MRLDSRKPSPQSDIRLQKHLASCGVGSRRHCEGLIVRGLVAVDGAIVTELGTRVDPDHARVTVRGKPVKAEAFESWLLHKPPGVLCTSCDPRGRPTILDFLPSGSVRLYSVGRLDGASEGLLLVTNDGELANRLTHPRHHIPKQYRVWTTRALTPDERRTMMTGVAVDGVRMKMAAIRPVTQKPPCYEVVLKEGRNRQIRRMLGANGIGVTRLMRVAIGPLRLGTLPPGHSRRLTDSDLCALRSDGADSAGSRGHAGGRVG